MGPVTRRWVILCLTLGLFPLQSHGAFCPSTPKCLLTRRGSTNENRKRGRFLSMELSSSVWLCLRSGLYGSLSIQELLKEAFWMISSTMENLSGWETNLALIMSLLWYYVASRLEILTTTLTETSWTTRMASNQKVTNFFPLPPQRGLFYKRKFCLSVGLLSVQILSSFSFSAHFLLFLGE